MSLKNELMDFYQSKSEQEELTVTDVLNQLLQEEPNTDYIDLSNL